MSTAKTVKRSQIRWPGKDTLYTVNPDGSRNFLHPADVSGRWQVRKNLMWTVLILVYLLLPWIRVGGHPAVHIDIPGRAAYLFGMTFTNQDFYLVFFPLSALGFALFVATSLWGRVWCGYACPQTVFMEGVFRRIERWIEGPRSKRIRRNLGKWDADKIVRKGFKHAVFLGLCWLLAHAFTAYFIPVEELRQAILGNPADHWSAFLWTTAWTGVLYFDYSWFREQTCLIICPYGRLQSALIDQDTVVIGYDEKRGEPRSKVDDDGGDCIDCYRCVQVCPTGIDIRDGLQMECVGCANCIDACDEIMDRIGRPHGLVRYDSGRGFETGERRALLRPRFFLYIALGLVGLAVATLALGSRTAFEAKVLRARGMPYILEEGRIRNLFQVRVQNKQDEPRTFLIEPDPATGEGLDPEFLVPQPRVRVAGMSEAQVPIFIYVDRERFSGSFPMAFTVIDSASGVVRTAEARFLGP